MSATAAHISELRYKVGETSVSSTFTDEHLSLIIERYPVTDDYGYEPDEGPYADRFGDDDWTPTYDLNRAASDVWEEKAVEVACEYDLSADGASMSRSQMFENYMKLARRFRARAKARSVSIVPLTPEVDNAQV